MTLVPYLQFPPLAPSGSYNIKCFYKPAWKDVQNSNDDSLLSLHSVFTLWEIQRDLSHKLNIDELSWDDSGKYYKKWFYDQIR